MAEIVAFDVDSDDKFNVENRLAEPEDVLNMCSSLVISIETNSDGPFRPEVMVRLAHFSVKEYLVSDRTRTGSAAFFSIDEKASNARIGATCLLCLQLYDEALFPGTMEFLTEFPLARYSAEFWYKHLSAISGTAHLIPLPLATELFLSEDKMQNWIALWDIDSVLNWHIDMSDSIETSRGSPLYYAVLTSLKSLVEALIKCQEDKNSQAGATKDRKLKRPDTDDDSSTLQYMSKGAFVNVTGGVMHTPLQAASWSGRMDMVELLIDNGADPNIYGGRWGGSALWAAAHKGHIDIMKHLLDTGADIYEGILPETPGGSKEGGIGRSDAKNLPDKEINRHKKYDQKLLKENMKYLAKDEKIYKDVIHPSIDTYDRRALEQRRRTALYGAAYSGDAEVARFILDRDDHGLLINLRNIAWGETALFRAARNGHDAVVQILLQRGALVDKTNIHGQTALMMACLTGNESIACKLLDKGADPTWTGQNQGKPMIEAICNDDERMVRLFLEKGALVDVAENHVGSPLRAAVVRGHEPIVRLLIDHGANVDDHFPLIEAVRRGYKDIAKLLVEKGADVNAVQSFDHKDGVPLWLYTLPTTSCLADMKRKLHSISSVCLRPKIRHRSKGQGSVWEDNPLWVAAALGDEESVKLLLDNGANPKVRGACAITPLDMAIFEEHEAVIQLLLAADKDSNSEIEIIGHNEPGDPAEEEISTPPLRSDRNDVFEAFQELLEPPQPSQAPEISDLEYLQPQTTQPLDESTIDESTDLSRTAQQQPQSSLPNPPN